jgi:hypothetical protein
MTMGSDNGCSALRNGDLSYYRINSGWWRRNPGSHSNRLIVAVKPIHSAYSSTSSLVRVVRRVKLRTRSARKTVAAIPITKTVAAL